MSRDYGAELDSISAQLAELEQLVRQLTEGHAGFIEPGGDGNRQTGTVSQEADEPGGAIYFSGHYRTASENVRFEPKARSMDELLAIGSDKAAKVLAALGHKQRLDLLLAVWGQPLTGAELVERLNMGTTGQLYHHLKALTGADLLVQEERGGRYAVAAHRRLPLMLLLAGAADLIDASRYIDMTSARAEAHVYLGAAGNGGHDPHQLLWAVVDNCLLEHRAGYCSEVGIYVHDDGSATVSDNGRSIPVRLLPHSAEPVVQSVMTELERLAGSAEFIAPGGEKGISIAVVNALSRKLSVEIRREGNVFRQEYQRGIPQTGLMTVGKTSETGTSVTFKPEPELFAGGFDASLLQARILELAEAYPGLTIRLGS